MAVVQQEDVAGAKIVDQPSVYALWIAFGGIEGTARSRSESEIETSQDRVEQRVSQAGGRSEEARLLTGDVGKRDLRGGDVGLHAADPECGESP